MISPLLNFDNVLSFFHFPFKVDAFDQHGIGGRLWKAGEESVKITIIGSSGQRVGAMGFPNTFIEIMGTASDDADCLNAGARIVIHSHAGNGLANAMAQGCQILNRV